MTSFRRMRPLLASLAVASALIFVAASADARVGRSLSTGSRGTHTFSAPPPTATAPSTAKPLERSMTQPGQPSVTSPAPGGLFGRPGGMFGGVFGGLFAGFLGAGLFGLLFGHGLFGGLGGIGSIFGLLIQLALVFFIGRLIWGWWQRRQTPAYAGAAMQPHGAPSGLGFGGFGLGGASAAPQPAGTPITIGQSDFDAFERLLGEIQLAYGAEDLAALRARVTPEMLSYFSEDLAKNASDGVVNRIAGVKLLQGDLSEAWSEDGGEYATVAMRFSLIDTTVDRASGRVVEGDATHPVEVTELWTFRRSRGGAWLLSAIQQV